MTAVPTAFPPTADRRRRRGFTLVELLVVIGILLLLVVTTLPAFRAIREGGRESGALNGLRAGLGTARALAMSSGTDVAVVFRFDTRTRTTSMQFVEQVGRVERPGGGMGPATVFAPIAGEDRVELPADVAVLGYGYAADADDGNDAALWYGDLGAQRNRLSSAFDDESVDPWLFPRTDIRGLLEPGEDPDTRDIERMDTFIIRFGPEGTVVTNDGDLASPGVAGIGTRFAISGESFLELDSPSANDDEEYLRWTPRLITAGEGPDEVRGELQMRPVPHLIVVDLEALRDDTGIERPWEMAGTERGALDPDGDEDGTPDVLEIHEWARANARVVAFNRYTGTMMPPYRK